jgi:hypothetical protein
METMGYTMNDVHRVFAKSDAASIRKSKATKKRKSTAASKEGKKFYATAIDW